MVAAPWRCSTPGHSISAAAAPADCGAGELRFPESPEKKDFTLLANEALEDAGVADAVGAGAGGALSPVRPPNEEHAARVAATAAATAGSRQRSISLCKAPARAVGRLRPLKFIMQAPCSERRPAPTLISPANEKEGWRKRLSLAWPRG